MQEHNLELFASCLAGLERPLADELKRLGVKRVRPLGGGVAFFCGAAEVLRACLWSRLASRVMLVVGRVDARDAEALYAGVRALPWEDVVAAGASLAVRAHGTNDELRNTKFTALKVKDALCDRLRAERGERPDVDAQSPDALVDVRVNDARATVSLDLAGETLHRRTYLPPDAGEDAALSCGLAAGLLALAGWGGAAAVGGGLVDPACGDGVLVCEAASAACDLAPGLARERWGFFGWARHDEDAWGALLDEADDRFERGLAALAGTQAADAPASAAPDLARVRIAGTATSSPAVARARECVKRAGLRQVASIEAAGAEDVPAVARRVAAVAPAGAEPPLVVASVLRADHASGDAASVADASAFAAACLAAPAGSRFAVAGDDDGVAAARFAAEPRVSETLGRGRIAVQAAVFYEPPQAAHAVRVPDPAGGSEHVLHVLEPTSDQFAARLRKNAKERRKWARREGVFCYRVYDADLPDYNVAIDVYEGAGDAQGVTFLHVAEYQAPSSVDAGRAQRRFEDVLALAPVVLGVRPDHVFSKVRRRERGGGQYRDAGRRPYVTWTAEDGYRFEVDLSGYLDTGLFLDHRLTREMVGERSRGVRFLNLFAYTGSATVHAAGGGAVETTTVDLSQTYLDWARRNMELNGFTGPEHSFVRADAMAFVTETRRRPLRYDLAFVDPPTFSNSKAMGKRTWDVQRDHAELLIGVSRLLTEGGVAVFSCNLRSFKPDVETLAKYGVALEDVTEATIPHDFERNPRIHRCYLARRAQ